jgi:hypothetical protein
MLMRKIRNHAGPPQLKVYGKGLFVVLSVALLFGFVQPIQKKATEYQIKAVFLFNFAQFVDWPEHTFSGPESPLIIGILGSDPFGSYLDETVENEKINGHPLMIKRYKNLNEIDSCHILFISAQPPPQIDIVTKTLTGRNILTVSDAGNFVKQGGMVRLFTEDNKIKLRINLEVIKAEKFVVSSKLLRMAEIADAK